jgi:hypothetical protein
VQQVQDSVAGLRGEATAPAERTVAANCERWVALQQAKIDSREFCFKVGAKAVEMWTAEEFRAGLDAATGQLRLHLLLMANCGFTQEDISDLLDTEVDWRAGRITRKRSKTHDHSNVPVVNYKLWPPTFALLKEYRSGRERVMLTASGKCWKRKELIDG